MNAFSATLRQLPILGMLAALVFQPWEISAAQGADRPATVWLSELGLSPVQQDWGEAKADRSVQGNPLTIAGQTFARGIGTHANSLMYVDLKGTAERFTASVGVDDEVGTQPGSVEFMVIGDNKPLWKSGLMSAGSPARGVNVDVRGIHTLLLLVGDAGDGINFDHADWADAQLTMIAGHPDTVAAPTEEAVILTPKPGPDPRINGPRIYGCGPGHPFLYRVPCTGDRPIQFSAEGLPHSLALDETTGIISGTAPGRGEYAVVLRARNQHGRSERPFKIVAGDQLALTPPMGFNDWYAFYNRVTAADMRAAADMMISNGMADVGYQYVNVDDCWMGTRDAHGDIAGNERFPDMKALADYIHGKGLKAGLYTSPGPKTCAGYEGAFQHVAQDAAQFAAWGFDFLKYDWCSYRDADGRKDLAALQKPYRIMGDLLRQQDRDIVFNLCQYGMGEVWTWGAEVGGHAWRTGGDLGFELHRIFEIALRNCALREYNRPGAWNDPDYIQIGYIGVARGMGMPRPAPLSPNESYAFMSLWSLMAAPLFYSGDMARLDEFTLNILCNPEVIDVNQDPLGQCARLVGDPGTTFVLVKDLEDGSKAVGLCNRGPYDIPVTVSWSDLKWEGSHEVRDLWRHKDLGSFADSFTVSVPRRGVALVRVGQ